MKYLSNWHFDLRLINREMSFAYLSYNEAKYITTMRDFPLNYYSSSLILKLNNSVKQYSLKEAMDQCRKLIKVSISLHDFKLFQKSLFLFVREGRLLKQYKEFVFSKKNLELDVVKKVVSHSPLLEFSILLN